MNRTDSMSRYPENQTQPAPCIKGPSPVAWWILISAIVLVILAFSAVPGCSSAELDALRQKVAQTQDLVNELETVAIEGQKQLAEAQAKIATMPEGPERDQAVKAHDRIKTAVDEVRAYLATAKTAVTDFQKRIADAKNGGQLVGEGLQTAGSFIPAPYGWIVGLAGAALAAIFARAKSQAVHVTEDIVKSIQLGKETPEARTVNLDLVDGKMSDEARLAVKKILFAAKPTPAK